jgi:hypothetical protein
MMPQHYLSRNLSFKQPRHAQFKILYGIGITYSAMHHVHNVIIYPSYFSNFEPF